MNNNNKSQYELRLSRKPVLLKLIEACDFSQKVEE